MPNRMTDDSEYDGIERRSRQPWGGLSEDELESLIEKIARRVTDNFYKDVGKTVVNRVLWVIGVGAVFIAMYLFGTGKAKVTL